MRVEDLSKALADLKGASVKRPNGTLAGHAAGLPFERVVHERLEKAFPRRTYRHFELLNKILESHPECQEANNRLELLGPPSLQYLLKRGKKAMNGWTTSNRFIEKQNDTAETVILPTSKIEICPTSSVPTILVDVKTQDEQKKAQPPNIISAVKVANTCCLSLGSENFLPFDIAYVGIKWSAGSKDLVLKDISVVSLTRIKPATIYINWAAAQQIQFHPFDVDTSFRGTRKEWAQEYLEVFCEQLERRIAKERVKLLGFKKFIS